MPKICDNKSVGQIIRDGKNILLIERHNYPQAIALPAGHLDGDTFEFAAKKECEEEVGLTIQENKLVWQGEIGNPCKRQGGSHHAWQVYEAVSWSGNPKAGDDAKRCFWATPEELAAFARRTEYFAGKYGIPLINAGDLINKIFGSPAQKNTDSEWQEAMGLEPTWYFLLKELKVI